MPTVFFGPFIGEFGWELLFWHGWVRKVCRGPFRAYRKIAASVSGREPFYPEVDEFWPLPEWFTDLDMSRHGYGADGWRAGYPGIRQDVYTLRSVLGSLRRLRRPARVRIERPLSTPDVEPTAETLLEEFRRLLPAHTEMFVPWKLNRYEPDRLEFGQEILELGGGTLGVKQRAIGFEHQLFEDLEPTEAGVRAFEQLVPQERPLIAVFPRARTIRRPEKNWPRETYVDLIRCLSREWPEYRLAIIGEPGGAYFADGVPEGCLDLINVPDARRMDLQIAALKRCVMALGGMSGALLVALAAGCPALIWGSAHEQARYYHENVRGTPMLYASSGTDLSLETVLELCRSFRHMLRGWDTRTQHRVELRVEVPVGSAAAGGD